MEKIKILVLTVGILSSFTTYAGIISVVSGTDTSFGTTGTADLQGLEWLTLDMTQGESRVSIKSGYGGYLADGWKYATRAQTETLLNSLWDGTYHGWSSGNGAGANWFEDNFGGTGFTTDLTNLTYTNFNYSDFNFGEDYSCTTSIVNGCLGGVRWADESNYNQTAYNVLTSLTETSYTAHEGQLGWFGEYSGVNMGFDNENNLSYRGLEASYISNLLVRPSITVPEPSIIGLFLAGLFGLGFTLYRRDQK